MSEARGTFACPICAWPTPHSHSAEEIAERPVIDGCRAEFERVMRTRMYKLISDNRWRDYATSYWWGYPVDRFDVTRSHEQYGWARRDSYGGDYSVPLVQHCWAIWRMSWMTARGAKFAADDPWTVELPKDDEWSRPHESWCMFGAGIGDDDDRCTCNLGTTATPATETGETS